MSPKRVGLVGVCARPGGVARVLGRRFWLTLPSALHAWHPRPHVASVKCAPRRCDLRPWSDSPTWSWRRFLAVMIWGKHCWRW